MGRTTLRQQLRKAREDAILDAAHDLLMEQGYAEMSMDDLAARLGASKATLYQHFVSKEDLTVRVLVRLMQRGEQHLQQQDASLAAITRLEQTIRKGLDRKAGMWATRANLLPASVTQHAEYQAHHARLSSSVAAVVEQAKAEGDVVPHLSTPIVTSILVNLFHSNFDELLNSGAFTVDQVSDTLVTVIFNGLRPREA